MLTKIVGFSTEKELQQLTGLNHEQLWDNDFDLDDWDFGFQTDKPLDVGQKWLDYQLDMYCCGCKHTEYDSKHYYLAYHS